MQYPEWLNRDIYPFNPHYIDLDVGRMHYVDEGEGETIVMLHGNPTWSFLYRDMIKGLSSNFRCVAFDYIGFGLSDKPAEWDYLPRSHAAHIEAALEQLGLQNITLVVQDWAGPIGLSYAVNHPENVKRLVIMNTWMWPVEDDWIFRIFSSILGSSLGRWLIMRHNFFSAVLMRGAIADKDRFTTGIHLHYKCPHDTYAKRKGVWVFPREIIGSTRWLSQLWAKRDNLVNKPVLLAWGMKDTAFREIHLRRWHRLFPDATIIHFEDAGHYVQEEKGSEMAQHITAFMKEKA